MPHRGNTVPRTNVAANEQGRLSGATQMPAQKEAIDLRKMAQSEASVNIDYPKSGEIITVPKYTLRINAKGATRVEACIDDLPWTPCRSAVGYWWYDWSGYNPGKHQINVRTYRTDGTVVASALRQVFVGTKS